MANKRASRWDPAAGPSDNARRVLPAMARRLFAKSRKVAAAEASAGGLHRFRLATKRFRYTLELFRPLYGPGLDKRLMVLRSLQQLLGEINDCATTRELLRAGPDARTPQVRKLLAFLDSLAATRTRKFRRYLAGTFDAPGQEDRWVDYLSRFAGRASRS